MQKFETRDSGEQIQEQVKENNISLEIGKLKSEVQSILGNEVLIENHNSHLMVEHELARIFQLGKGEVEKLDEDFKEPMTLAGVLAQAQDLWENINYGDAENDEIYGGNIYNEAYLVAA